VTSNPDRAPARPLRYTTSSFDYELPPDRIALRPAAQRDASRLLVVHRDSGALEHRTFTDLADLIEPADVLVLNESRVIPARLLGVRPGGGTAEVVLLNPVAEIGQNSGREQAEIGQKSGRERAEHGQDSGRERAEIGQNTGGGEGWPAEWTALVRPGSKLRAGRRVRMGEDLEVEIVEVLEDGTRRVRLHTSLEIRDAVQTYGRMPLPPYIERDVEPADAERYQTVYARAEGSVAAPTAGLHFTPALLDRLRGKGVAIARVVLHVGVGTFRPIEVEDPDEHVMHAEWYEVPADDARIMNDARRSGGRLWAVGTTVTRTLESSVVTGEGARPFTGEGARPFTGEGAGAFTGSGTDGRGTRGMGEGAFTGAGTAAGGAAEILAGSGWTRLFIRPGYEFRAVDRLITNFHLPRSTLLMLVSAFAGYDLTRAAYETAVREHYRFYSYGDAMAIL
jgi:S-adenosylmethionine:tRNA ribosyltransferase-isomerase